MSHPETRRLGGRLRVAVLMGGTSTEREVSLVSGKMVTAALDPDLYDVMALDTRDLLRLTSGENPALLASGGTKQGIAAALQSAGDAAGLSRDPGESRTAMFRPDVVFIALHGKGGEDGTVQGMLEVMGLPYTGSGVLASALAMDKVMSKCVFKAAGVPVIDGIYVTRHALAGCGEEEFRHASLVDVETHLGFPVFVKPNAGGSTCGCSLVAGPDQLFAAVQLALTLDETALIEKYIRGMEITVGVIDFAGEPAEALPVIEIVPKGEYYDYESKYASGGSEHIIPARIPDEIARKAQEIACRCHALLGCRGVSRTDFILSDGLLYVLEVNTIPGMTPTSLLPQAAEHAGISFAQLLDRLIRSALDHKQGALHD